MKIGNINQQTSERRHLLHPGEQLFLHFHRLNTQPYSYSMNINRDLIFPMPEN